MFAPQQLVCDPPINEVEDEQHKALQCGLFHCFTRRQHDYNLHYVLYKVIQRERKQRQHTE